MLRSQVYFWKQMPFVRILIPFITGILLQWKFTFPFLFVLGFLAATFFLLLIIEFLPISIKYLLRWLQGAGILIFLTALGAVITYEKSYKNNVSWIGSQYKDSSSLLVVLQEPLVEKANSYKAEGTIKAIRMNEEWKEVVGKMIIYFKKDSVPPGIGYGSQIIFQKTLQPIKNSGNPGAFDYARFNAFQNIYHQVFLKSGEYVVTPLVKIDAWQKWLQDTRKWVIGNLEKYIRGEKETGVAEALLIGYKNNLDKDLVQAYSNTGVVHIIAISGLHLGMIYLVLVLLLKPLQKNRWVKWLRPIIMLAVLWIFSLLAGGAPSIMRSAVMFSFIIVGESIGRKTSIYNTLAASAFVLLVYNPFYLWAVGFQLSYTAVASIVTFMRPIYDWFYIKNKLLDMVWKLSSITLSAQLLTFPIILFYFHQFPNLFMITNIVVVPVATIVLYGELLLILLSPIDAVGNILGNAVSKLLHFMNSFIERMSSLYFSVTENIFINPAQTLILYLLIIATSFWLLKKSKPALFFALGLVLIFFGIGSYMEMNVNAQKKLIVYNVPQHHAIDFMESDHYYFAGDSVLLTDDFLKNFHLNPARVIYQVAQASHLKGLATGHPFYEFHNKRIAVIDKSYQFSAAEKIPLDMIVLTGNPKIYISKLATVFDCKLYVFDGSNPLWKTKLWKKDCDSLHLRHYDTAVEGALEWDVSKPL